MGILDKVKEGAAQATAVAKDAAQKGQAKFDAMTAKRAADALLRDLGAASYAERTGRTGANYADQINRILAALDEHEQANGPIDLTLTTA
jgi:hypothetical protein